MSVDLGLRAEILDAARSHITKDRAATHGRAENSFNDIAAHWSWWLAEKLKEPISAYDVAQMMVGFKQARAKGNPGHRDNHEDLCGYAAIGGEIALNAKAPDQAPEAQSLGAMLKDALEKQGIEVVELKDNKILRARQGYALKPSYQTDEQDTEVDGDLIKAQIAEAMKGTGLSFGFDRVLRGIERAQRAIYALDTPKKISAFGELAGYQMTKAARDAYDRGELVSSQLADGTPVFMIKGGSFAHNMSSLGLDDITGIVKENPNIPKDEVDNTQITPVGGEADSFIRSDRDSKFDRIMSGIQELIALLSKKVGD